MSFDRSSRITAFLGIAVVAVVSFPAVAQAQYLDPGTGSIIVQAVIAVVVGALAAVKLYWRKITGFLGRRSKRGLES